MHGAYPRFKGYKNAYDKSLFSPDRYLSDSRMRFRTDLDEFVKKASRVPVQLLLHPLHYSEDGDGYPGIFFRFLEEFLGRTDSYWRMNSSYRSQLPRPLFETAARMTRNRRT